MYSIKEVIEFIIWINLSQLWQHFEFQVIQFRKQLFMMTSNFTFISLNNPLKLRAKLYSYFL